jgi:NADPH:quinone reductase-like Zn-dependent oxidoreductase
MRALVVTELGGTPELLDVAEPSRASGEALLDVIAAPLNPVDLRVASGTFFTGPPRVPYIAGAEAVARVVEGEATRAGTLVWIGAEGHGQSRDGCLAERVTASESSLVPVPDGADPALAAALGIAGLAGWLPVEWRGRLRPGETVLVLGATGVVGLVAVQAARLLGAGRVVAAGRRKEALERCVEVGADATVVLSPEGDLAEAFRRACGGDGPDLLHDLLHDGRGIYHGEAQCCLARVQLGEIQEIGDELLLRPRVARDHRAGLIAFLLPIGSQQ